MYLKTPTPLLIVGFNRPNTLTVLLLEIERLSAREVWISIDGSRFHSDNQNVDLTIRAAENWALNSRHTVKVIKRELNLGIYNHCTQALKEFYSHFEIGIIFEDDIQFNQSFVQFVDWNQSKLLSGEYWSICGHNPSRDLTDVNPGEEIDFRATEVHTIWGWAAHRNSIKYYLEFKARFDLTELIQTINVASKRITNDPFVILGIRKVWSHKILRAINSDSGGGWDNFWLLAGWNSGLPSLIPSHSLSRENPIQLEGQSHAHRSNANMWDSASSPVLVKMEVSSRAKENDISLLKVWGISRIYCWFYVFRLLKWNPNVSS